MKVWKNKTSELKLRFDSRSFLDAAPVDNKAQRSGD